MRVSRSKMRRSSTRDAGMVWAVLLIASCAGKHRNSDSDAGISGGAAGAGAGGNGTGGSGTVGTGAGGSGTVGTGAGGSGTAGTGSAGRSAGGMSFGGTGFGGTGFGGTGFGGTGFGGIAPDGGGALGTGATGAGRGGTAGASAGRGGTAGALADGGGAGGRGGVSGSGGTAGSAGNCAADLGRCARNADCCGFATGRNLCIDTGDPTLGLACLITCTQGTECQSGCCAPLESGDHVYGPAALCGNCAADLEACTQNSDCCGFSTGDNVCVDTGPSPAGIGVACLIVCTSGTECQSGCCAAVNGSAGARVCAPTSACG